ncbi:hypothetical protein Tco_0916487 [Tanacetum coccineum]
MLMCKQAKKGVPLQVEQVDWLEDMDEEIDEQDLEAHYSFMEKIQEVWSDDRYYILTEVITAYPGVSWSRDKV